MEMKLLHVQAGASSASAKANVVVMGQDEFHDALESAAESASIASTSDRQYNSGTNHASYLHTSCSRPRQYLPAYGTVFLLISCMLLSPVYCPGLQVEVNILASLVMETHGYGQQMHVICIIAEEEVRPEERQLALRPADMSFEQAMLHYMAQMNDRQGFCEGSDITYHG